MMQTSSSPYLAVEVVSKAESRAVTLRGLTFPQADGVVRWTGEERSRRQTCWRIFKIRVGLQRILCIHKSVHLIISTWTGLWVTHLHTPHTPAVVQSWIDLPNIANVPHVPYVHTVVIIHTRQVPGHRVKG